MANVRGTNLPRDLKKPVPLAARAQGIFIYDDAGTRYIDGCSGALISGIGHCVPEVVEAIARQLKTLDFAHPSRWRNHSAEQTAAELADLTPESLNHIWFVCGGSEAVESSLKLARQYFVERDGRSSSKHQIIGRWNSYHGATLGAMAVAGNMPRRRIFAPMFKEHPKISPHYCYRCAYGLAYPACELACARELENAIQRIGADSLAAFIAEPIVGSTAGALVPPDEYWPMIREICDRHDILLIADEIMTGIGRTGKAFCVDHWQVVPDIIVAAKGIAAGYVPAGAVCVSEAIAETIRRGSGRFQHGFTYNANPVSTAAIRAVIRYIREHDLIDNAACRGRELEQMLAPLEEISIVGQVRGKGLMWGVELVSDRGSGQPFPPDSAAAEVVAEQCMSRGLVVYPGSGMVNGVEGDSFLVAPPLTVNRQQIEEIGSILHAGLKAAEKNLRRGGAATAGR